MVLVSPQSVAPSVLCEHLQVPPPAQPTVPPPEQESAPGGQPPGTLTLQLPVQAPDVAVPVIELTLCD